MQRRFGAKKMAAASTKGFPDFSFFFHRESEYEIFPTRCRCRRREKSGLKKGGGERLTFFCVVLFEGMTSMLLLSAKERAERERVKKKVRLHPSFSPKKCFVNKHEFSKGF